MSYVLADRVKQKCSVIGTGTITLGAAITQYKTFESVLAQGDTFHYLIVNITNGEWETGLGTYSTVGGGTITRTSVLSSSNNDSVVTFTTGEKEIMIALLSGNAAIRDGAGRLTVNSVQLTADALADGSTNRFFSNTLARNALSGGTNITYNTSTGEIALSDDIEIAGDVHVLGSTTIEGNLTVNGITTTINSEVTTLNDPVIALGGDGPLTVDDGQDRGVQFRYYTDGVEKIGFFGWQHDTGKFIYIPEATNFEGEYSGALGPIDFRVTQPALVLEKVTTNRTLAPGEGISVNTADGSVEIELPASPALNDSVIIADGGGDKITKPVYIRRNGSTINGVADDLLFNVPLARLYFVYDNSTWRMTHNA